MYSGAGRGKGLGRGRPNRQLEHLEFLDDDFLSSQWPERLQSSRASRNYQFLPGSTTWRSRLPPRVFGPSTRDDTGPTSARSTPALLQRDKTSSNPRSVGQARQWLRNTAARLPPSRSPRHDVFPQTPDSASFGSPPAFTRRVQFNVLSPTPPVLQNDAMSEYVRIISTAMTDSSPYRIPTTPQSAPRTDHETSKPAPRQRGRGRDHLSQPSPSVPVGQSPRPSSLRIPRTPAGNTLSSRADDGYDLDEDAVVTTPLASRLRTRRSGPTARTSTASTSYPKPRSSGRTVKSKKKQDPEERSYVPETAEYEDDSDAVDTEPATAGRRTRSSGRKARARARASNYRDHWPWASIPVGQSPPPPWLRRPAPTAYTPAPPRAKKSRKRKQDASFRPDEASDSDGDVILMLPPVKRRKIGKAAADVKTATTSYPKPSSSGRKGKGRTKPKPEELSYVPESPEDEDEPKAGPATSKTRGSGHKRKTKESDRSFVPTVETEDDDDDKEDDLNLAEADNEAAWNSINSVPFRRRIVPRHGHLFRPSQGWANRPPNTQFAGSPVLPDAQDFHVTDGNDGDEQDDSRSVVDLASEDIDAAWDDVFSRSSSSHDSDEDKDDDQDDSQSVVDLASKDIDAAWDDIITRTSPPCIRVAPWQPRAPHVYPSHKHHTLVGRPLNRHFNMDLALPGELNDQISDESEDKRASDNLTVTGSSSSSSSSSSGGDDNEDKGEDGDDQYEKQNEVAGDADVNGYHTAPTTPVHTNKRRAAEAFAHTQDDEAPASNPKLTRRGRLPQPTKAVDLAEDDEATESSPQPARRRGRTSKVNAAEATASRTKPARSGRQSKQEKTAAPEPLKQRSSRLVHVAVSTAAAAAPAQTPGSGSVGEAADSEAPPTRTREAAKRRAAAAPEAASAPNAKKQKQAPSKTQQKLQQKKPQPAAAVGTRRSTRLRRTA